MNNINDKPSLHWSDKTLKKVEKIIRKNNKFNYSNRNTAFSKVPHFCEMSWKDFLPFFIGWFHALYSISVAYGMMKSSSVFNKALYINLKNKFALCMTFFYIFGPLAVFSILVFGPMAVLNDKAWLDGWGKTLQEFFTDQAYSQKIALMTFNEQIITPFFTTNAWWVTLLIFAFVPCINVPAIVTFLVMNPENNNWMKLIFLENDLKMKITSFEKTK